MTTQNILAAIKAAVDLRNQIQTSIAAGAHVLPAVEAVPATAKTPAIPAQPAQATGQLPTAAGFAHQLAVNLFGHLINIEDDEKLIKEAQAIIATAAPAPEKAAA